jgi:hypothetical protein
MGDRIIRVELVGSFACVLSLKLCKNGKGVIVWVYVGCNDVDFNNKVEGNKLLITKLKKKKMRWPQNFENLNRCGKWL